jgi:hypothetical protein
MTDRLSALTKLHSSSSRQDLLELIEEQEILLLRGADREIESFVKPVLERLAKKPSLAHLGDEGEWPFTGSLEEAGFLSHFFWAQWEHLYDRYWRRSFEDAILRECQSAIGNINDWSSFQHDLFEACRCVEQGLEPTTLTVEKWTARNLALKVYDLLIDGDMDTVRDCGVDVYDDEDEDEDEDYRENWS